MVLQKAQDAVGNLKDRPKEDKKVIAGGIAIMVIVALFFVWAILFLKKIQRGDQKLELQVGAEEVFLSDSVRQAQEDLQGMFSNTDELEAARDQAASQQFGSQGVEQVLDTSGEEKPSPFEQ